jgi:hypothetical protein
MPAPLKLVFMGSDSIALPLLDWLTGEGSVTTRLLAIYTQPDRPTGRGQKVEPGPIKQWALAHGVPVRQPEKLSDEERTWLAAQQADVGLVMAYGHILREAFLATPRLGTLNLHASILPKYRGASPIQTAVVCGERETGVTFMRVVRQLDAGPVADVERVADYIAVLDHGVLRACCPVEAFRGSVKEVHLRFSGVPPTLPKIPGLLQAFRTERELRVTCVHYSKAIEQALQALAPLQMEMAPISLEDAFISYLGERGEKSFILSETEVQP